jgi:2-methylcitrate dehydratase PrpD
MEIMEKHGITAEDVERIECLVSYMYPRTLIHSRPRTGLQAKTSLEGCVAIAFVDKGPKLSSFTDAAVRRPAIQKLMEKIVVTVPPELSENIPEVRKAPFDQPVALRVTTRDGKTVAATVRDHRGMPDNPATQEDLRRKFIDCADGFFDAGKVDEVIAYVGKENASVRGLTNLLNARS